MKEYRICRRCVMDTSDSKIKFDQDGICDHCTTFDKDIASTWDMSGYGKDKLIKIVDKIKQEGKKHDFDCLMGMSGGFDSSYLLHMMVTEFDLRPLVLHVDAG